MPILFHCVSVNYAKFLQSEFLIYFMTDFALSTKCHFSLYRIYVSICSIFDFLMFSSRSVNSSVLRWEYRCRCMDHYLGLTVTCSFQMLSIL